MIYIDGCTGATYPIATFVCPDPEHHQRRQLVGREPEEFAIVNILGYRIDWYWSGIVTPSVGSVHISDSRDVWKFELEWWIMYWKNGFNSRLLVIVPSDFGGHPLQLECPLRRLEWAIAS